MLTAQDIYELRLALGMTAVQFGARLGVTWNTVFRWEGGHRYPSRRHQIILNELRKELEDRKALAQAV